MLTLHFHTSSVTVTAAQQGPIQGAHGALLPLPAIIHSSWDCQQPEQRETDHISYFIYGSQCLWNPDSHAIILRIPGSKMPAHTSREAGAQWQSSWKADPAKWSVNTSPGLGAHWKHICAHRAAVGCIPVTAPRGFYFVLHFTGKSC